LSTGLNWKISSRTEIQGKAVASLRITPTSELPQPLELVVTCLGGIESIINVGFYPDPTQPTEADRNAEAEIPHHPVGQREVFLILRSPKLHPPSYLEVLLRSIGNAEIRVLTVRRNPEGVGCDFWD
jgi:hypothetical protein